MIDHTIEQVEEQRRALISTGCRLHVQTDLGERWFSYYVVPQNYHEPLPDFILRSTNDATENYVIGVSDSVPEELQPFFALAEYIEFIEIGNKQRGRVREAEESVMRVIPHTLRHSYTERKTRLLAKELELDSKDPDFYLLGEEGRREFREAINFLRRPEEGLGLN